MCFGWYLAEMGRKLQNGAEVRLVIDEFEEKMRQVEILLGPFSLKQMKKSGRISAAAAFAGELLGLRPIISMIDGKTTVLSKVRGDDKVVPSMLDQCKKRLDGMDLADVEYMIGHTDIDRKDELIKAAKKMFGHGPVAVFQLGGVVSANTGPDTVALVFTGKTRTRT